MHSGVGQGRINSPWFFNVYINDLIVKLRCSGFGCYLGFCYAGCLFFADDILLLSGSILHLQCMLDICSCFGAEFDIVFNHKKSFLMQVGLDVDVVLPQLSLSGVLLQWVNRIKYLGVWFVSGRSFSIDPACNRTKFLGSVFGILQKCGNVSDDVKWNIIQRSCLPILLYGVDSVTLKAGQVQKLSVAYNTAVRRCFNLSRFTSVRNVLYFLGSSPVNVILDERLGLMLKSCIGSGSELLRLCSLLRQNDDSVCNMFLKYDVHINMSRPMFKSCIRSWLSDNLRIEGLI
jgi:hypothetical protein